MIGFARGPGWRSARKLLGDPHLELMRHEIPFGREPAAIGRHRAARRLQIREDPDVLLFTGACGTPADWPKLGTSTLTNNTPTSPYGTTKGGSTISTLARAQDDGTMWAGTGAGRVLVSRNINAADPATVTFTRLDGPLQPGRAVSSIFADPTDPNHAIVTYSGYNVTTAATPGHVFDVHENGTVTPGSGTFANLNVESGSSAFPTPFSDGDLPVSDGQDVGPSALVHDYRAHALIIAHDGPGRGRSDDPSGQATRAVRRPERSGDPSGQATWAVRRPGRCSPTAPQRPGPDRRVPRRAGPPRRATRPRGG